MKRRDFLKKIGILPAVIPVVKTIDWSKMEKNEEDNGYTQGEYTGPFDVSKLDPGSFSSASAVFYPGLMYGSDHHD